MKNTIALAAVLVALAGLLFGGWRWLATPTPENTLAEILPPSEEAPVTPSEALRPVEPRPHAKEASPPSPPPASFLPEPPPLVPHGITGRVINVAGGPVPGAVVSAELVRPQTDLDRYVLMAKRSRDDASTSSGRNGEFTLDLDLGAWAGSEAAKRVTLGE